MALAGHFQGLWRFLRLMGLRFGTVAVGLGVSVLWTRCAPVEVYGRYQMLVSLITMVGGFCLSGMEESVTIAAAKRLDGNFRPLLLTKLLACGLGALVVAGMGLTWRGEHPDLAVPALGAAVLFVPWMLTATVYSWLNGRGQTQRLFVIQLALSVVQLAALAGTLWLGTTSTLALFSCNIVPQVLLNVLLLCVLLRQRENRVRDPGSLRYGWWVSALSIFGSLILSDKLLLGDAIGPAEVAIYAIALAFPDNIRTFYSVINQMLVPDMYKAKSVSEAWACIKPRMPAIVAAFAAIGVVGFFLIPLAIPLLFSEKYVAAAVYGKWLWLSLALSAPATYLGNILRAQQRLPFVVAVCIMLPSVQFVLYLLLLRYGITGLVGTRLLMHWVTCFAYLIFFLYYHGKETKSCRPHD